MVIKFIKSLNLNIIEIFKDGDLLIKFRDEFISNNKFLRIIGSKKYYFENNKEILFLKEIKTKFISKLNKIKNLTNNIITLDIETYIKDNVLVPFCISIYDGHKTKSFFITDYINVEEMILDALNSILIRKYNGYKVYVHNLAKFDVIFLLKYFVKLGSMQPIIHKGKIISVNLNFGKDNQYQIEFKDSYLLLLHSLYKLAKSFKVENLKLIFPYKFVQDYNLNYVGPVPEFKYFSKISKVEYQEYKTLFNNKS
jgi:hypothetical protein